MKDLKQFIKTTIREFLNENKNNIKDYFFDDGYHFGTLYKEGRFLELRHDGSINEYGWRNF
jgi:guanylate kinase